MLNPAMPDTVFDGAFASEDAHFYENENTAAKLRAATRNWKANRAAKKAAEEVQNQEVEEEKQEEHEIEEPKVTSSQEQIREDDEGKEKEQDEKKDAEKTEAVPVAMPEAVAPAAEGTIPRDGCDSLAAEGAAAPPEEFSVATPEPVPDKLGGWMPSDDLNPRFAEAARRQDAAVEAAETTSATEGAKNAAGKPKRRADASAERPPRTSKASDAFGELTTDDVENMTKKSPEVMATRVLRSNQARTQTARSSTPPNRTAASSPPGRAAPAKPSPGRRGSPSRDREAMPKSQAWGRGAALGSSPMVEPPEDLPMPRMAAAVPEASPESSNSTQRSVRPEVAREAESETSNVSHRNPKDIADPQIINYIIDELNRRNRDLEIQKQGAEASREELIVKLQNEIEDRRRREEEMMKRLEFLEKAKTVQSVNPQHPAQPVPAQHSVGVPPNSVDRPDPFFSPGGDPWPREPHHQHQQHPQAPQVPPQTALGASRGPYGRPTGGGVPSERMPGHPSAAASGGSNGGGVPQERMPEPSLRESPGSPGAGGEPPDGDRDEERRGEKRKKSDRRAPRGGPSGPPGGGGGGGDDEPDSSGGESTSDESGCSDSTEARRSQKRNAKIRPLKDKQLGHPDRYDASTSTSGFRQWRERFRALIAAQDDGISWDKILDHIEQMREKIVCPDELLRIRKRFRLKRRHLKVIQGNLYHMLQQYTKGSTNERVITATREMSLDQYRILYFEGMHVSEHALFLAKGRVWRVAEAKKAADFAQSVDSWEQDRDFLERHVSYTMPVSDQQYALLNICPADLRREVLREYSLAKYPSYLSLKQHIQNLITRDRDLQSQAALRGVHEVQGPKGQKKQQQQQQQQQQEAWWGEGDWSQEQAWDQQEQQQQQDLSQQEGTWVDEQGYTYVGALKGKNGKGKGGKGGKSKGKGGKGGKIGKGKGERVDVQYVGPQTTGKTNANLTQ